MNGGIVGFLHNIATSFFFFLVLISIVAISWLWSKIKKQTIKEGFIMKVLFRLTVLMLVTLFLFPITVYADSPSASPPSEQYDWNWEYVVSVPPRVFYVDTTKEHVLLPEKNISVYYLLLWNPTDNDEPYTITQVAARLNSDHTVSVRGECMISLNENGEIVKKIETPSEWMAVPIGSAVVQAAIFLSKRGLI